MCTNEPAEVSYRVLLTEELTRRQNRNPKYSLRSFAKALGVSATTLSEAINGKRSLRRDSAQKIADRLAISPQERSRFILSAMGVEGDENSFSATSRQSKADAYRPFEVDQFKAISDWYHLAILSLAKLKRNKSEPAWVAEHLGITKSEAEEAMDRLFRLGMIERKGSRFFCTTRPLFVRGKAACAAIRKYHRQNLEKALDSLEQDPIEVRDFTSITMAIDPEKIETARAMVKEFREKLAEFLEQGDQTSVYTLAVQLFPVTKGTGGFK